MRVQKRLFGLLLAALLFAPLVSCGPSTEDLAKEVQASMLSQCI